MSALARKAVTEVKGRSIVRSHSGDSDYERQCCARDCCRPHYGRHRDDAVSEASTVLCAGPDLRRSSGDFGVSSGIGKPDIAAGLIRVTASFSGD